VFVAINNLLKHEEQCFGTFSLEAMFSQKGGSGLSLNYSIYTRSLCPKLTYSSLS
jgi:hypothetical protein